MLVASWGGRGRGGDPGLWAIGRAQSGRAGARHLGHPGIRGQSRTEPEASPQQIHASAGEVPVAAGTWHCRLQRFCALPVALAAQAWALGNVQLNKTQPLRAVEVSSRCGDEDTGNHPHKFPGPWPHMSTRGCSHRKKQLLRLRGPEVRAQGADEAGPRGISEGASVRPQGLGLPALPGVLWLTRHHPVPHVVCPQSESVSHGPIRTSVAGFRVPPQSRMASS